MKMSWNETDRWAVRDQDPQLNPHMWLVYLDPPVAERGFMTIGPMPKEQGQFIANRLNMAQEGRR